MEDSKKIIEVPVRFSAKDSLSKIVKEQGERMNAILDEIEDGINKDKDGE